MQIKRLVVMGRIQKSGSSDADRGLVALRVRREYPLGFTEVVWRRAWREEDSASLRLQDGERGIITPLCLFQDFNPARN